MICLKDLHVPDDYVVVFMSRTYVSFDFLVSNEIHLSFSFDPVKAYEIIISIVFVKFVCYLGMS